MRQVSHLPRINSLWLVPCLFHDAFSVSYVQCPVLGRRDYDIWKGSYEIVKLSCHLPGQTEAIRKKVSIVGATVENQTGHILSTSLKCSSSGGKKFTLTKVIKFSSCVPSK